MQVGISTSSLFLKADNDKAMALFREWNVPVAEVFLSKLEYSVIANARSMNIYMEFRSAKDLDFIVEEMAKHNMVITEIEYTKSAAADGVHLSAVFSIRFKKKVAHENVMAMLSQIPGVVSVEEL